MTFQRLESLLGETQAPMAQRIAALSDEDLAGLAMELRAATAQDRKENQLLYWQPVNPRSMDVLQSTARQVIVKGGKRSSKTDTLLAELAIQVTGIVPDTLAGVYPTTKIRPPIRARICCESLTDVLVPVILPKLRWDRWNGDGAPGEGDRGHWGWIPRHCLLKGSWEASYSEKNRTLTLVNGSTVQMMSYDQDPEAGEGQSLHLVVHDEPPPRPWYKVNQMRTLDVGGQVFTGYTPPTEPDRAARAAWIFDEVVEPGIRGDPEIDVFVLRTLDNRILRPEQVAETVKGFTEVERRAILEGEETHLSGRVHPLFTDREQEWCFTCQRVEIAVEGGICATCGSRVETFTHVVDDWEPPARWPCYMVMDPHERRPCAMGWFRVSPYDEIVMQAEAWAEGDVGDWRKEIEQVEHEIIGRQPDQRLCDPNPLDAADHRQRSGWTLRRELSDHGLRVSPADDNFVVGRRRVDDALEPSPESRRPRLTVMRRCARTIHAFKRYTWDEYVHQEGKALKGKPRDQWKHFPDLVRYCLMANPSYYIERRVLAPRNGSGRNRRTGY